MNTDLDKIFRPQSIALIGASSRPGTIGYAILHNLIENSFKGKVFPINPKADFIHSIKCFSSILEVPDTIDLAIIIVHADYVGPTLEQCNEKGVKGIMVISSGFKEVGEEGTKKEEAILKIVRKYGMSMVGPNCFGVFNTDPECSMNATFSKAQPLPGRIGFMSQSGSLGEAILGLANDLNLGFSMFASVGNKADVSDVDILKYWGDDPNTDVILMYLESLDNPKEFTEIAKELSKKKPIVAIKAGRSVAGAKAVSSHTGSMAGLDVGTDALFQQCGIIRVSTLDELFGATIALSTQPLPKGDRIAVITNAGGPGILATDAVIDYGMKMATLDKKTTTLLREKLPLVASVNNPVDVIAAGGPESYRVAVEAILADPNVDALILIFVPPAVVDHRAVINEIVTAIKNDKNNKTVLGCFLAVPSEIDGSEEMIKQNIPIYTFPEAAARAMSVLVNRRKWIDQPICEPCSYKVQTKTVRQIIDNARAENRQTIIGRDALNILDAYGVNIPRTERAESAKEASKIAEELCFPVIMKLDGPEILHKTDIGGVSGDLRSVEDVSLAFETMQKNCEIAKTEFPGVIIQELVSDAVETIIGMNQDPAFGPLIMFGLGGIFVEVMKDVTFKVHPVTPHDVKEMIESRKGYPLLNGFRGAPPVDFECLEETILRLSQLVTDFPEIVSFDVNPFFAGATREGSKAVDARFML